MKVNRKISVPHKKRPIPSFVNKQDPEEETKEVMIP